MRQQYHLHVQEVGRRFVWDVNKLIKLAAALEVFDKPLTEIAQLDINYWYQDPKGPQPIPRDIALHAKLIYDCDLGFPIILDPDDILMDGMHRCCKALIEGHKTVKAVKFTELPTPDYIDPDWDSLPYEDNFQNVRAAFGLPYKSA